MKKILLQLAGKSDFHLDEKIDAFYLSGVCLKYAAMMIRGFFFSLLSSSISKHVFVGKNVCIKKKKNLSIGRNSKLHDGVKIDALSRDGVVLGDNVVLGERTRIECTGSLSMIGKGVKIGSHSSFGFECFFGAAGGIIVGDDVIAGEYVRFHSENHNYNDLNVLIRNQGVTHKGIVVGNNCWIGAGAVFLDGAKIGNGCVVAANAVVRGTFGDNCVIGGVPAKVLKQRDS